MGFPTLTGVKNKTVQKFLKEARKTGIPQEGLQKLLPDGVKLRATLDKDTVHIFSEMTEANGTKFCDRFMALLKKGKAKADRSIISNDKGTVWVSWFKNFFGKKKASVSIIGNSGHVPNTTAIVSKKGTAYQAVAYPNASVGRTGPAQMISSSQLKRIVSELVDNNKSYDDIVRDACR